MMWLASAHILAKRRIESEQRKRLQRTNANNGSCENRRARERVNERKEANESE
jgi:hypothetical protein